MARGFARVDNAGNLIASKGVAGMSKAVRNNQTVAFGAYCFKLEFAPDAIVASSIAHPEDTAFGPTFYTAGPNLTGVLTKDQNGTPIRCPDGYQDAAVIGRVESGDGLSVGLGGFFVVFE
jgi:hypothetical protein